MITKELSKRYPPLSKIEVVGAELRYVGSANDFLEAAANPHFIWPYPKMATGGSQCLEVTTRDSTYQLTPLEVRQLFLTNLTPVAWKALVAKHSVEDFYLHGDFYDDKGRALQPKLPWNKIAEPKFSMEGMPVARSRDIDL